MSRLILAAIVGAFAAALFLPLVAPRPAPPAAELLIRAGGAWCDVRSNPLAPPVRGRMLRGLTPIAPTS